MATSTSLEVLAAGLQGFGHPIRIRALVLLEAESTPRDLAQALGAPLGVTAYHVRMLRDYGLVTGTRTEPRRGAIAHYYVRTALADELLAQLNGLLGVPARGPGRPGTARRAALLEWADTAAA